MGPKVHQQFPLLATGLKPTGKGFVTTPSEQIEAFVTALQHTMNEIALPEQNDILETF